MNLQPRYEGNALSSATPPSDRSQGIPTAYKFCRALMRLWFALSFRKMRLLHGESMAACASAVLAVSNLASFLDALILVAAIGRQVHCLLERKLIRGSLGGLLARGLGMIVWEPGEKDWRSVAEKCCGFLARNEVVVAFADPHPGKAGAPAELAATAASIALEAEARHSGRLGLVVFPVHMFLPVERSQSSELLIYIDSPVDPQDYRVSPDGEPHSQVQRLAAVLEARYRGNAFRVQPEDLKQFVSDLEEILLADLEEDWASRANWKQKAEGFQLSGFVVDWVEQLDYLNPGRLVALREALDAWREARRRWSLRQFEVEGAGAWLKSPLPRAWVAFETVAGFPLALYGLINHLVVLLLLHAAGLLSRESHRDPTLAWVSRALLVLGCYTGQILVVAHLLGRAWAGYYAPSLPLSGAYLWRYAWLLSHRTRLAFLALTLPVQATKVRRMRKQLVAELNGILAVQAETLGVPH